MTPYALGVREVLRLIGWLCRDLEKAHEVAICFLRIASKPTLLGGALRALLSLLYAPKQATRVAFGTIHLPNCVLLSAGFTKDPRTLLALSAMGFGAVELGTITCDPQAGNPHPRMRILRKWNALLNWLGFSNPGAYETRERFRHCRMPRNGMKIGISIGPSKRAVATGDLKVIIDDLIMTLDYLFEFADFITLNLASPNTPHLRTLLDEPYFTAIMSALTRRMRQLENGRNRKRPFLVKLSPDAQDADLERIMGTCRRAVTRADGLIIGNTTTRRDFCPRFAEVPGGISGAPLYERMLHLIRMAHELTPELYIVASGGLGCAPKVMRGHKARRLSPREQATEAFAEGADLLAVMTGFIDIGPSIIKKLTTPLR